MADDINKSPLSGRGEELLRTRQQQLTRQTVGEVRLLERIAQDQEKIDRVLADSSKRYQQRMEEITVLAKRMEEMEKAVTVLRRGTEHGAEKQFMSSVRAHLGARTTIHDITSVQKASTTMGPALQMAQASSTSSIEATIARNQSLLQRLELRIQDSAELVSQPGGAAKFASQMQVRQRLLENIGTAQAAMGTQRKLGLDLSSQYHHASDVAKRTEAEIDTRGIQRAATSGQLGSRGQVEQKLEDVSKSLVETFKRYDEAVKSSSKSASELAKEFSKLESEQRKYKSALRAMDRGGAGSNMAQGISGTLTNLGVIGQAVGQGLMYENVTSELAQRQSRIGFAQLANQRFSNVYDATQGDASALRRTLTGTYDRQIQAGLEMGQAADVASLIGVGGSAAVMTGTGIDAITNAGSGIRSLVGSGMNPALAGANHVTGAAAKMSPAALQFHQQLTDYRKQITQSQVFQQAAQLSRQEEDVVNMIGDTGMQKALGQLRGGTMATRGMGSRREGFQSLMMDPFNVGLMADAGLSMQDMQRLTGAGVQLLGGQFGENGGASGMADILRGGQLARSGTLQSADQYIQARGALTGVGGESGDLERIMRNAVAAGMDNSKNIMEMVAATRGLAERSAVMGISTVGGASEMMARGTQALKELGVPPDMRSAAAAQAANVAEGAFTDSGMNIGNIAEFAKLRKLFPEAGIDELDTMARLSGSELREIQQGFAGGRGQETLDKFGLGMAGITQDSVEGLLDAGRTGAELGLTGVGMNRQGEQLMQRQRAGETLTSEEQRTLQQYQTRVGRRHGASGVAAFAQTNLTAGAAEGNLPSGPGGMTLSGEDTLAAAAQADAQLFNMGIAKFEELTNGLVNLGPTLSQLAQTLDPAMYAETTKQAAENLSAPLGQFGEKMAEFNTTIDKFTGGMNALLDKIGGIAKKHGVDLGNNVNPNQGRSVTGGTTPSARSRFPRN